jgi:hypothetical protein
MKKQPSIFTQLLKHSQKPPEYPIQLDLMDRHWNTK